MSKWVRHNPNSTNPIFNANPTSEPAALGDEMPPLPPENQ